MVRVSDWQQNSVQHQQWWEPLVLAVQTLPFSLAESEAKSGTQYNDKATMTLPFSLAEHEDKSGTESVELYL